MRWLWLVILAGCGGGSFGPGGQQQIAADSGHEGDPAGHDEASTVDPHDGSSSIDSEATETSVPEGSADAPGSPDTGSPPAWATSCFQDAGMAPASTGITSDCQPDGLTDIKCGNCPGAYGYTCWDNLPPSGDCSEWTGNPNVFCCETNTCTRGGETSDNQCQNMHPNMPYSYACNSGTMPPSPNICAQLSTSGTGTNEIVTYCCYP